MQEAAQVFKAVGSTEAGLTSAEAAKRLEQNGKNKLKEAQKETLLTKFLNQLKDPMIIILIVAAVISAFTEYFEAAQAGHTYFPTDTVIIMAVVLINAVLGVFQESKAEKAIEALQEMSENRRSRSDR